MELFEQLNEQVNVLLEVLQNVEPSQYTQPIYFLYNASIGEHTRHVIEIMQCLFIGYENCFVDYVHRERNLALQNDKHLAMNRLKEVLERLIMLPNKPIFLQTTELTTTESATTSYFREINFQIDHAIHHMALIRVALLDLNIPFDPMRFGLAYSTRKYQQNLTL